MVRNLLMSHGHFHLLWKRTGSRYLLEIKMTIELDKTVRGVFGEVPKTYELVNHVLTFGLDRVWRNRAAKLAGRVRPGLWCDMCTGTGEMAAHLKCFAPEGTRIMAVDFSPAMMSEANKKKDARNIDFVIADIMSQAGFKEVTFQRLLLGVAAIHQATKGMIT